jgi:hypothetical protein
MNADESPLSKVTTNGRTYDPWLYRIAVGGFVSTILFCVIGAITLRSFDKEIPDMLPALGTGSLGLLTGIFIPSPSMKLEGRGKTEEG